MSETRPPKRGGVQPLTAALAVVGLIGVALVIWNQAEAVAKRIPTDPATLRTNEELRKLRSEEEPLLTSGGMLDASAGSFAYPVSLAMEILAKSKSEAERGTGPSDAVSRPFEPNLPLIAKYEEDGTPIAEDTLKMIAEELSAVFGATPAEARFPIPDDGDEAKKAFYESLSANQPLLAKGAAVYARYCANCHGSSGAANGPNATSFMTRPRNFTFGVFKFTSTPNQIKPLREDVYESIAGGFRDPYKRVNMPGFGDTLTPEELKAVTEYTMFLAVRGETERKLLILGSAPDDEEGETLEDRIGVDVAEEAKTIVGEWAEATKLKYQLPPRVPATAESLKRGQQLFLGQAKCTDCHGYDARGNGQSFVDRPIYDKVVLEGKPLETAIREFYSERKAAGLESGDEESFVASKTRLWDDSKDEWGNPLRPADLTWGYYRGAHTSDRDRESLDKIAKSTFLRIAFGVNNAKMPAHYPNLLTSYDDVWHVVNFVMALPYAPELIKPVSEETTLISALSKGSVPDTGESGVSVSTIGVTMAVFAVAGLIWALIRDLNDDVRRGTERVLDDLDGEPDAPITT